LNFPAERILPAIRAALSWGALQGPNALDRSATAVQDVLGEIPGIKPYSPDAGVMVGGVRRMQAPARPGFDPESLKGISFTPSQTDALKSAFANQANWKDRTGKATMSQADEKAFRAASAALGNHLKDVSPEYSSLMKRMAPYEAAEKVAERTIANGSKRTALGSLADLAIAGGGFAHGGLGEGLLLGAGVAGARRYLSNGSGANLAARLSTNSQLPSIANEIAKLGHYSPLLSGSIRGAASQPPKKQPKR
jgi:hypothetical protein